MKKIEVVGAIFINKGRILSARRKPGKSAAGLWEFPGGKVETGEVPTSALVREIFEELAVPISVGELFDRSTTQVGNVLIDLACYFVTPTNEFPSASSDHDELRWLAFEELLSVDWALPDVPSVLKLSLILSD